MPILGVLASAITGNLVTGAYESIETITVTGATGYVEFTSIPATFTHLQVRCLVATSAGQTSVKARINSDTGNNYSWHAMYGPGNGSVYSDYNSNTTSEYNAFARGTAASNTFGSAIVDILDYKNTNKYKTMRSLAGVDENGGGLVWLASGLWQSTNAITTIRLTPDGGNLNTYSSFALYGIKGA